MSANSSPNPSYQSVAGKKQSDWISVLKKIWKDRRVLYVSSACGLLLGVIFALSMKSEYTATSVMVPQTGAGGQSQLSGLASLAGINLDMAQNSEISPVVYPKIVNSIPFKLELMNEKFSFSDYDKPVTLYDFYTSGKSSFASTVKKYTIGLPSLIFGSKKMQGDTAGISKAGINPVRLNENQIIVKRILDRNVFLEIDKKDGYLTLRVTMPEALAAAQVAQKVQDKLQREIIKLKTEKAQADLNFIQERYNAVKAEAEGYQVKVAASSDRFKDLVGSLPKVGTARLQTKYNISSTVFQELAKQLEQAKIQVKKDTPVFTVIEPVTVPYEKSGKSKSFIVVLWFLFGIVAGVGVIALRQNFSSIRDKWNNLP